MIYDNIKNFKRYQNIYGIGDILKTLYDLKEKPLADTQIVIEDKRVFINPVTLKSKKIEECIYESHRKYIDIHYIVSGCEGISVDDVNNLTLREPFSTENDIGFYKSDENITFYLNEGDFLICYPGEAHMVAMAKSEKEIAPITKYVGKVLE